MLGDNGAAIITTITLFIAPHLVKVRRANQDLRMGVWGVGGGGGDDGAEVHAAGVRQRWSKTALE